MRSFLKKSGYTLVEFCIAIAIMSIVLGESVLSTHVINTTQFCENTQTDLCCTMDMSLASYYRGHKVYPLDLDTLKSQGYLPSNCPVDKYSYTTNGHFQGYVLETTILAGVYRSPGSKIVGSVDVPSGSVEYAAAGSYTFTVPKNVSAVRVTLVGGGGGGGGGGQHHNREGYLWDYGYGGGAGTVSANNIVAVTSLSSITVTVGSGGPQGANNNVIYCTSGGAGGASIFGSLVANGGAGGAHAVVPNFNAATSVGQVSALSPYGNGGKGGVGYYNDYDGYSYTLATPGNAGYVKVEWGDGIN